MKAFQHGQSRVGAGAAEFFSQCFQPVFDEGQSRDYDECRIRVEQAPILTEEDEAALDEIWDKIGREERQ